MMRFLLIFIAFNISIFGYSQLGIHSLDHKNAFGASGGLSSGVGFSYRYQPKDYGLQVNFIPIKNIDNYWISLGVKGIKRLQHIDRTDLNIYAGLHYNYTYEKYSPYYYQNSGITIINKYNNIFFGGGFSVGYYISKDFLLDVGIGYALSYSNLHSNHYSLFPTLDISFLYLL